MKGCVKMGWLRKKFRSIKPHIGHFIYHVFGDRKYWKTSTVIENFALLFHKTIC